MDRTRQVILLSEWIAGILVWFVLRHALAGLFGWFNILDPLAGTPFPLTEIVGLVAGAATIASLHFVPSVQEWARLVADELTKVKWPTYTETRWSTVVVIGMVAVFTVILGLFDWIVASLTGLFYA